MQSQDEFNSLCLIVCSIFRRDAMHRVFTATNHHLVYFFIRIFLQWCCLCQPSKASLNDVALPV